jgi:hypothetical protein
MHCGPSCGGHGGMGGGGAGMGGSTGGMSGGLGGWNPFMGVQRANCPDHPRKHELSQCPDSR